MTVTNLLHTRQPDTATITKLRKSSYIVTIVFDSTDDQKFFYSTDRGITWYQVTNTVESRHKFQIDARTMGLWYSSADVAETSEVYFEEVGHTSNPFYGKPLSGRQKFTPVWTAFGGTTRHNRGNYWVMGEIIFFTIAVDFATNSDTDQVICGNLPYKCASLNSMSQCTVSTYFSGSGEAEGLIAYNTNDLYMYWTAGIMRYSDINNQQLKITGWYPAESQG